MGELIRAYAPVMGFMLVPLWIPLIAVSVGALRDLLGGETRRP